MGTKKGDYRKTSRRAYRPKRRRVKRGRNTNLFEYFFGRLK